MAVIIYIKTRLKKEILGLLYINNEAVLYLIFRRSLQTVDNELIKKNNVIKD